MRLPPPLPRTRQRSTPLSTPPYTVSSQQLSAPSHHPGLEWLCRRTTPSLTQPQTSGDLRSPQATLEPVPTNTLGPRPTLGPHGAIWSFTLFKAVSPHCTFLRFDHKRTGSPATRCSAEAISARAKSALPQRSRLAPKSSHASDSLSLITTPPPAMTYSQ